MAATLHWLGWAGGMLFYYAVMFGGMLIVPLGIPGEFAIPIATAVFTLVVGSSVMPWWVTGVLLVLALAAEGVEALAGFAGAKGAKGSIWSAFGAIGGGFVGALAGAPFGLLIGSVGGAFVGTFGGAFAVEYLITRSHAGSSRVASGALFGRVVGSVVKMGTAFLMIVIVTAVLVTGWLSGRSGEDGEAESGTVMVSPPADVPAAETDGGQAGEASSQVQDSRNSAARSSDQ